ncbi:hypothetical protein SCHPADRAFT_894940 [Schizopora paradoxa]|uniref:Uncharacterized protein n=1 Tax=Schizopora paradoxa TaxID=27342 RepID=A0A0H2R5F2_9AGAM|nr:hypothetical protein SCHPADRAFT_894940 [Schizopora paradoxa]
MKSLRRVVIFNHDHDHDHRATTSSTICSTRATHASSHLVKSFPTDMKLDEKTYIEWTNVAGNWSRPWIGEHGWGALLVSQSISIHHPNAGHSETKFAPSTLRAVVRWHSKRLDASCGLFWRTQMRNVFKRLLRAEFLSRREEKSLSLKGTMKLQEKPLGGAKSKATATRQTKDLVRTRTEYDGCSQLSLNHVDDFRSRPFRFASNDRAAEFQILSRLE